MLTISKFEHYLVDYMRSFFEGAPPEEYEFNLWITLWTGVDKSGTALRYLIWGDDLRRAAEMLVANHISGPWPRVSEVRLAINDALRERHYWERRPWVGPIK